MLVDQPLRKQFSYVQTLNSSPDRIFPLLCPVEEEKWVPDWSPSIVFSYGGCIENHCIFITDDGVNRAIWLVSTYEPEQYILELFKVTPEHSVGRIKIRLQQDGEGQTRAEVTYEYTAIAPEGVKFVEAFNEEGYRLFMRRWQDALNYYLEHGTKMPS